MNNNKLIADDTLHILEHGLIANNNGTIIDIKADLDYSVKNTIFYSSDVLQSYLENQTLISKYNTIYEVKRSSSLAAIFDEVALGENNIMCLNFASAKNPGGGFINGAQAQEESIARSSGLYLTQLKDDTYYKTHRAMKSCVYTDNMIYSPAVPIFKKDNGSLLPAPIKCDFITSAAVNAGVVKQREPDMIEKIKPLMEARIDKMLALSYKYEKEVLILGAWGCGVFQNEPEMIASIFKTSLEGKYKNIFKKVIFAIYSKDINFLTFEKYLCNV